MDFAFTPEQNAYRERVRAALRELLPADWEETYVPQSYASDLQVEFSRGFCHALAERGLLVSHWPPEYGGAGAQAWEQFILAEEMKAVGEPRGGQYMNVNWIGPALMRYGSDAQKALHLPAIADGRTVWCQGFSEPSAGTDLAALQTRAARQADGSYVINGSKIWTSYARRADWCFLLARTGEGRRAISVFLTPMTTPGISVSSLPGLCKDGHLNEVFLSDVRVGPEALLGEEGKGWEVVTYALALERVGVPRYHTGLKILGIAMAQLKAEGRAGDPVIRSRAATIAAKFEAARWLTYRVVDQRVKAMAPNTDSNVARVASLEAVPDLMNFLMDYVPDCLTGGHPLLEEYYQVNVPATITAGVFELQLDLIAQQGLGLQRG